MPKTLSIGSTSPDVTLLQSTLNAKLPGALPPLKADGMFGPKTLQRVKEYQMANGLVPDGVVGPMTWAALQGQSGGGPVVVAARTGCNCGQHDPNNHGVGEWIKSLYYQMVNLGAALGFGAMGGSSSGSGSGGSGPLRMLTETQKNTLHPYFGDSLDYSTVFISDKSGAQNRPFTMAFPDTNQTVQIINCGTFNPKDTTLIHEMMHVWQSQHHADKYAFMKAAVACQAAAAGKNATEVVSDPDVMLHHEWPIQYPYSAYAYLTGSDLDAYGAEQAANAVEHGNSTVCMTVKAAAKNSVNAKNTTSLSLTRYGDRRTPKITF
ncbi:MAG TPA: peptidoglycan-binding domain-containing protein [Verrucomicrobiales bacterium]|nr:peptidoglycan-binding domain-containing protein [Verrucomicrobiales bacterium]